MSVVFLSHSDSCPYRKTGIVFDPAYPPKNKKCSVHRYVYNSAFGPFFLLSRRLALLLLLVLYDKTISCSTWYIVFHVEYVWTTTMMMIFIELISPVRSEKFCRHASKAETVHFFRQAHFLSCTLYLFYVWIHTPGDRVLSRLHFSVKYPTFCLSSSSSPLLWVCVQLDPSKIEGWIIIWSVGKNVDVFFCDFLWRVLISQCSYVH